MCFYLPLFPPQVCPFSTLVLYTNECQSLYQDGHIIKFADDSVIVSLLHDTDCDRDPVVDDFVSMVWTVFS